jgi:hypothetical protein
MSWDICDNVCSGLQNWCYCFYRWRHNVFYVQTHPRYLGLLTNWTFSLWCALLIKSWSLNWPWSIKILGQFVTRACKFISQSDVKHIMTSPIKTITSVLKAWTDIITDIPTHPKLAEIISSAHQRENVQFVNKPKYQGWVWLENKINENQLK